MLDHAERDAIYQIAIVQARTQRTPTDRRRWQYADWTGLDRRLVIVASLRTEPRVWIDAE